MKFRNSRYRRPDPLLLLAVFVGLGVILSTSVRAESLFLGGIPAANVAKPVVTSSGQGDTSLRTLPSSENRSLAIAGIRALNRLAGAGEPILAPFGSKGMKLDLGLGVHEDAASPAQTLRSGATETTGEPALYLNFRRSW